MISLSPMNCLLRMKTPLISLLSLLCLLSLSACAKKASIAEADAATAVPATDITRPPKLVVDKSKQADEQDPEQTISYDKWRKEQAEDE